MRSVYFLCAYIFGMLLMGGASAATVSAFTFSFQDGLNVANGSLLAEDVGGGQFLATSGALNVTAGAATGTYTLVPGGPDLTLSPTGTYNFDSLVAPDADSVFTNGGLVFAGPGFEINIYSVGPGEFKFDYFTGGVNTIDATNGTLTLSAATVPEPSETMLFVLGLSVLMVAHRLKSRSA